MDNTKEKEQKQEESLDSIIWEIADLTEDGMSEFEFNKIKELLKSHIPQWISVKNRLPEKDTWVITLDPENTQRPVQDNKYIWFDDDPEFLQHHWLTGYNITHWIPLPKAGGGK